MPETLDRLLDEIFRWRGLGDDPPLSGPAALRLRARPSAVDPGGAPAGAGGG